MSWVSKQLKSVGKVAKKAGKAIGKGWEAIDDVALPAVGFALGGPAGAAAGAAAARAIGDGKFNAKATLMAGAKGAAMGAMGSAAGLTGGAGLKALGSSALKAAANPLTTAGSVLKSQVPGMGGGAAGGAAGGGILGGGGFGLGDALQLGSGALSAFGGYKAGQQQEAAMKRAQGLQDRALQFADQQYNERAPYRKLGMEMALNQTPEDVSSLFATSNPFAARYRKLG